MLEIPMSNKLTWHITFNLGALKTCVQCSVTHRAPDGAVAFGGLRTAVTSVTFCKDPPDHRTCDHHSHFRDFHM